MRVFYCPHCGTELLDQARFCSRCGGAIAWEEPSIAATEEVAAAQPAETKPQLEDARTVAPTPNGLDRKVSDAVVEPLVESANSEVEESTASQRDVALPIPENIAAVIAYITPIPAVVFLYLNPFRQNRFVRFHAMQHLLLFVAAVAAFVATAILWMVLQLIPFMRVLVFPFAGLISLAWFFLWLLLVVKAYRYEMFKLPWIGDYAEEWSQA